jgi:hypothetical protein
MVNRILDVIWVALVQQVLILVLMVEEPQIAVFLADLAGFA